MRIFISTIILLVLFHIAFGQTHSLDTRKHFEYTDTSFEIGAVKIQCCIYFGFDGPGLRDESFVHLDSLVDFLDYHPELSIEIGSNTDNKGNDKYNLRLSQARAQEVVYYLSIKGIASARLFAKGYGETFPIAPNEIDGKDNPEGRQFNRRTEIKIISINAPHAQSIRPALLNPTDEVIHFLFGEKTFPLPLSLFNVRSIEMIIDSYKQIDTTFNNQYRMYPRSYLGFIDDKGDSIVMATINFSPSHPNLSTSLFNGNSIDMTQLLVINLSKRVCLSPHRFK